MRIDNRPDDRLRPVSIETGVQKWAEGSALISLGNTRVLCAVTVQEGVPDWLKGKGRGWVTAEYGMLPRATGTRTQRDSGRAKPNSRALEIQRLIGRSLRAVTDLPALGERTLIADCDVIQADGGTRTAAITGAWVTLALACKWLAAREPATKPALREPVAAVSVGMKKGGLLLDLDYAEDSSTGVDMNVVLTRSGRLVEVQGTAEKEPFTDAELAAMLALARTGAAELFAAQRAALAKAGITA
jgi:ribonuclease PH